MKQNWFPSHMSRAKREIIENLKIVDTVIEVLDARAPLATQNGAIKRIAAGKNRIILINKSDLVGEEDIEKIEKHFRKELRYSTCISLKNGTGVRKIFQQLDAIYRSKSEKAARKRMKALPIKVMVIGVPNVGKSKLINTLTGRKVTGVANVPGFTKGKQWIRILPNVNLLDTPGVLWTKDKESDQRKLAMIGTLKDRVTDAENIAYDILDRIGKEKIAQFFSLKLVPNIDLFEQLSELLKEKDLEKIYNKVINSFRKGDIGQFCLDNF